MVDRHFNDSIWLLEKSSSCFELLELNLAKCQEEFTTANSVRIVEGVCQHQLSDRHHLSVFGLFKSCCLKFVFKIILSRKILIIEFSHMFE